MTMSPEKFRVYARLLDAAGERVLTDEEVAELNALTEGDIEASGLDAHLGTSYVAVGPRLMSMRLEIGPQHLQPWGLANGGVYSTLGESCGSIAGFIAAGADRPVVGVNNNTDFYRSAKAGDAIISTASPVHLGRTSQVWEIRHTREADGKLLSRTNLRLAVLPKDSGSGE
ncbi:PaaI family thioesterase [uncultured Corynebacterium sp.]|uniref:PaaI family thioesterase n=1 Tax=uncultured Corynebacterium sp. TaxID=159447 RepID=UPI0025DC438A|nr:PaaI family thioesterase [uncultured Corynebacterium sp.]